MLLTDDEALYRRALFLRDHGRRPGDKMFFNHEVAYKYKMSSMQAALGLAQLERVEELLERKRRIFGWYEVELAGVAGVTLNYEAPGTRNVYWMVTVVLDPGHGLRKERLMELLDERGIDTRPFFFPLSSIPAYRDTEQAARARERNRVSYRVTPYGLNLPSGMNMTEEKVAYVCEALKGVLRGQPREAAVVKSPAPAASV
jgi:perosamine synthetase